MRQLGDILVADGLITPDQLAEIENERRQAGTSLARLLLDRRLVTEKQMVSSVANQIGLRFVELGDYPVDVSAVSRVPAAVCRRHLVLPLGYEEGRLLLAMADPGNVIAVDDVRSFTGLEVRPVAATRTDIDAAIERYLRAEGDLGDLTGALGMEEDEPVEEELTGVKEIFEEAPIVKYVNLVVDQAIDDGASDIHLEPAEKALVVRFRIDGVLHEVMRSPKAIQSGVISRLKIMADIDIAERRLPQDGRLTLNKRGHKVDLRVATLPTVWGEKVVMRVLDTSSTRLELTDLGFSEDNYERFARSYTKPYGLILVTGPTGSGKSTTLYATLNQLNSEGVNIITVEDPVEYRLAGVNQIQVNLKAGLTFATALRSILRADPDIVLIGEIRDHETALIAVEAALTGHLVLATLHTNDAPSSVTRLAEMGIEPFLVGSAVDCVLAQRLARRLCVRCREEYTPTPESLVQTGFPWRPDEPLPTLYRAMGCGACARTGFRGRIALQEVMVAGEEIERLTVQRASATKIKDVARTEGMATLREDGMAKVAAGITSLDEVLRVVA